MKKEIKRNEMDVVFLLDRSGSMCNITEDTIGGYNSYLEQMKKEKNVKITTVLFDHEYDMLTNREDINNVKPLTNETYFTRGSTALLDAIGRTITYVESYKPEKVLFVITTDGYENASIEYNKASIKKLIEKHPDWEFVYIGADVDSFGEASSLGIKRDNVASYKKDKKGVSTLFESVGKASKMMMDCSFSSSWKDDLDEYMSDK